MYVSVYLLAVTALYIFYRFWQRFNKINSTPLSNFPSFRYGKIPGFESWVGAIRFMRDPANFLLAGYEAHRDNKGPSSCFKLSDLYDEFVVICDKRKIVECYAAPPNVLSSFERNKENIQIEWIMGKAMHDNPFPIKVIRTRATAEIVNHLENGQVEVLAALNAVVGKTSDWKPITVFQLSALIVARFSNFVFGGEELSRNEPYIELLSTFGRSFITSIQILRLCPGRTKDFVKNFMPSHTRELRARALLAPYLQRRLDDFSAGLKQRDDLLQWLIREGPSHQRDVTHLVQSLFAVHAAVQSATTFFIANAIFMLSSDPEQYMPELRAEIYQHAPEGTFDKSVLDKLVKLDSFLRESARINNAFLLTAERLATEDFSFSDGTFVPKGTTLAVPQLAVHRDANVYPDPTFFDPWRYARTRQSMSEGGGAEETWQGPGMQVPDTNGSDYVHFGHSKHTCPGRHFATIAAKLVLANIILRYDIQRIPGVPPVVRSNYYGIFNVPDVKYQILMRPTSFV